jgi:hypothetical protein
MQSLDSFRKPDSNKTMGIEWEMFWDQNDPKCNNVFAGRHYKFFYVTTDGSLRWQGLRSWDMKVRELVSQPLPYAWLNKELERINKIIPQVQVNDTCGIHVHVTRKWATAKKVDHLVAFLKSLTTEDHQAAFGREPNAYCRHMAGWTSSSERYYALNTTNKATVEFRMFKSGDLAWAQYCLGLVNYMMTQANTLNKGAFFAFVDMTYPD